MHYSVFNKGRFYIGTNSVDTPNQCIMGFLHYSICIIAISTVYNFPLDVTGVQSGCLFYIRFTLHTLVGCSSLKCCSGGLLASPRDGYVALFPTQYVSESPHSPVGFFFPL